MFDENPEIKTCSKCGESKSLDAFGKDRKAPDGKFYWCKQCTVEQSRRYYAANKKKCRESSLVIYHRNQKSEDFRSRRNARQREFSKDYTKRPETREKMRVWSKTYMSNIRNRIS